MSSTESEGSDFEVDGFEEDESDVEERPDPLARERLRYVFQDTDSEDDDPDFQFAGFQVHNKNDNK